MKGIIIKVTVEQTFIVNYTPVEEIPQLMEEWFVEHRKGSHAYRDSSKVYGSDKLLTYEILDIVDE